MLVWVKTVGLTANCGHSLFQDCDGGVQQRVNPKVHNVFDLLVGFRTQNGYSGNTTTYGEWVSETEQREKILVTS